MFACTMQGTARRLAGGPALLPLLLLLLGANAAPPPFILHHLAQHLKASDDHHGSSPTVVFAQPAAPMYAQSPYYAPQLPQRLVIQVEPAHHRNLPAAQNHNQGPGEAGRPARVRTQAVKGSALPPHQTFVQVKVADPRRLPGGALAAVAPTDASAAAAPAASAASASAAATSVNALQHFGGLNAHALGASGEEWLSELPAPALHGFSSPHSMTGVFQPPADVPSLL